MTAMLIQTTPEEPAQNEAEVAAAPGNPIAAFMLLAGVVLLIIVLMGRIKKKNKRSSKEPVLEPKERIETIRAKSDTAAVLQNRVAQSAEITRELTALIDNRSEKLDLLIQHADERINRLERLSQEAEQRLTPRHAETQSTPEKPKPEATLATDALRQQIYDLADQGHVVNEIAQRLGQHAGKVELILALRRA